MIKVVGARVLVKKEKIDSGGLKLTPSSDHDGLKNTGTIIGIGSFWLRFFGLKKGRVIHFKKYFITNEDQPTELVFVHFLDILALNK